MLGEIQNYLLENWQRLEIPDPKPSSLSFIRRSSTWMDEAGKTVFYVFRYGDRRPVVIGKTVSSIKFAKRIVFEAESVEKVKNSLPDNMQLTIPRPLGLLYINEVPLHFELSIPGITFPERFYKIWMENKRKSFVYRTMGEINNWLVNFESSLGIKKIVLNESNTNELFVKPIEQFLARTSFDKKELIAINQLEKSLQLYQGSILPLTPSHGDFWGGSMICSTTSSLGIIDWEFFKKESLPLADLFMLAIHPGIQINSYSKSSLLEEFKACFYENWFSNHMKQTLQTMCNTLGINREILPLLFMMFLINTSLERDRLTSDRVNDNRWETLISYYLENHPTKLGF